MRLRYFLLLIFLFLTMGPLLLFRAWPHSEVLQGELEEVHERHLLLARNLAAALERYHTDLETTFELLLNNPESWTKGDALGDVLENLSVQHLCIADWKTGRVIHTLALTEQPCPNVIPTEAMERFRVLAKPEEVSFGAVVAAPNGENVIHMVKSLGDALAIGAVKTTYFRELGEAISFGVLGHAAIVDQTGRALAHPLPDWVDARKDLTKVSAVQRMLNRETGVETFYSPALKGDMIAGFTFVDPVGWGVMIPQPIAELHDKAAIARQSGIVVLLIGIVLALACALLISLRVVRPLEQVSQASALIAGGEFRVPEPVGPMRFLPVEFSELQTRFHDMVRRLRENMRTINALAYVDSVTRLGNRAYLQKKLDEVLKNRDEGTLMLIDLDGFKNVNDMYGHDVGDKVLSTVGARLLEVLEVESLADSQEARFDETSPIWIAAPIVARLGGDEFAVWLPETNHDVVSDFANQFVKRLRMPMSLSETEARIGASVGIARHPEDASDRSELIKAADLAMYSAKKAGKNQFTFFTPELKAAMVQKQQLGHEIEQGLKNGEFIPYFQPQFRLPDRQVTGVEALARWQHPERGLLGPSAFLETAHEIGLLTDIDATILDRSVECMLDLANSGPRVASLAINVSEERLTSPEFMDSMRSLPELPFDLRFELVETMVLDKIEGRLAWTLNQIREHGYLLDLDDFGSANASVLGLMNIEPAHLKIDRNLIFGMDKGNVAERLVRSIIQMGHSLEIPIIAEGAEDMECVASLEAMNCDFVQGFALARPMGFEALKQFLR